MLASVEQLIVVNRWTNATLKNVKYWNTDSKSEVAAGAIQALFAQAIYFQAAAAHATSP